MFDYQKKDMVLKAAWDLKNIGTGKNLVSCKRLCTRANSVSRAVLGDIFGWAAAYRAATEAQCRL